MIRLALLWMFIVGFGMYAFRDWYKSLCALILFMGVMEHPDIPNKLFGVQGLNPWNILLIFVILGWLSNKGTEGLKWDMPSHVTILLIIYLLVMLVGFYRMVIDQERIVEFAILSGARDIPDTTSLISDDLINSLKWVIPGLLLFHGCNSYDRFKMAVVVTLGIYFLLALQVIKWMPLGMIAGGGGMSDRAAKILQNEIGYNRDTLSTLLAGAFWAILSATFLVKRKGIAWCITFAAFLAFLAQALTGGRAGYLSWAGVGVTVGFIRWRKYLLLIPLLLVCVFLFAPSVSKRMSTGFDEETVQYYEHLEASPYFEGTEADYALYSITSGRSFAWPYVIDKIKEAPFLGYGRKAMQRTGLSTHLLQDYKESFPHPHGAYLQLLMDSGLLGFLPVIVFYIVVVKYSLSLLRDTRSSTFIVMGGITFSLVVAQLIASLSSHYFYPNESVVGLWCAIGLMFRVYVERARVTSSHSTAELQDIDQLLWNGSGNIKSAK